MKRNRTFVVLLLGVAFACSALAEPFVVIVRHAEKASSEKDPDLSAAGLKRADELAQMLKDSGITAIFTSELKRTQQTAAPLAKTLGIAPTIVPAGDTNALIAKLRELKGNALVVGHGNTIPNLIKELGIDASVTIHESDYTQVLVVTLGEKPQLLRLAYPH